MMGSSGILWDPAGIRLLHSIECSFHGAQGDFAAGSHQIPARSGPKELLRLAKWLNLSIRMAFSRSDRFSPPPRLTLDRSRGLPCGSWRLMLGGGAGGDGRGVIERKGELFEKRMHLAAMGVISVALCNLVILDEKDLFSNLRPWARKRILSFLAQARKFENKSFSSAITGGQYMV